jgi:hypothetical protein
MEIKAYYFGIAQKVMLYQKIGFAESFGVTSPTARNDVSARLCKARHKPKHALVGSRSPSQHYL